ncbi:MAG: ribonuclease P protein component [Anaerolineae bacterium]|nr:ribonuclease P protein component [Anaerolineae bacterium]
MERQIWQKAMRLRRPEEFKQVWSKGRSWAHPLLILWALPNDLGRVRVGITASRKVGKAVARNRARRLLREAARQLYHHIASGWDVVLVARAPLLEVKAPDVMQALESLLRRSQLWIILEDTEQG